MKIHEKTVDRIYMAIFTVASVFRLWLYQIQNINVDIRYGGSDGWLQVRQTASIASGKWLGTFDNDVLVKEVGYPLFCAMLNVLQIPYGIGVGILNAVCCAMVVIALRPYLKNRFIQIIFYSVLLYCPVSFRTMYIYRPAILYILPIALMSCVLAIFARRNTEEKIGTFLVWGSLGFFFGGLFWISKEDSIWILPFMIAEFVVCVATSIISMKKDELEKRIVTAIMIAQILPFAGMIFANHAVSLINEKYYGIYTSNDRTKGEFARLCSLLYRIESEDAYDNPDVWISRGAMEKAMECSDQMKTLENLFDKCEEYGQNPAYGGWPKGDITTWAIRSSAWTAGYYKSEVAATEFYSAVADDLEAAFDDGRLTVKKGIKLSNYVKPYTVYELQTALSNSFKTQFMFMRHVNEKADDEVYFVDSSLANIWFFEKTFNVKLPLSEKKIKKMRFKKDYQFEENESLIRDRERFSHFVVLFDSIYRYASLASIPLSFAGICYMLLATIKKRKGEWEKFLISISLFLASFSVIMLTALFTLWMTKEPGSSPFVAYAPSAFLILEVFKLFCIFAPIDELLRNR